jgi:hypothetical protein
MNKKPWHSRCHYKRNSSSVPAGTNNPTRLGNPRSDRGPTGGPPPPDPATVATTPPRAAKQLRQRLRGRCYDRRALTRRGREPAIQAGRRRPRATAGVGNLIGREAISSCRRLEARRQVFALVRTAQSVGAALAVCSATVVRAEGVVLRPSRVTGAHLSRHGWRKSPRN